MLVHRHGDVQPHASLPSHAVSFLISQKSVSRSVGQSISMFVLSFDLNAGDTTTAENALVLLRRHSHTAHQPLSSS